MYRKKSVSVFCYDKLRNFIIYRKKLSYRWQTVRRISRVCKGVADPKHTPFPNILLPHRIWPFYAKKDGYKKFKW